MKIRSNIKEKNKFGFTLIELLAVIVILAIIALIATPVMLDIIEDAKKSSLLRSAKFYEDAVIYSVAELEDLFEVSYQITEKGDLCKTDLPCKKEDTIKVRADGKKPTGGKVTIENGEIIDISLKYGDKKISKSMEGEFIYSYCTYVSGEKYAIGSKYECEVKPGKTFNFFILSHEEDGTTNLIMDRNICSDGEPTGDGRKCHTPYYTSSLNTKGPMEAIKYLNSATKSWENIENLNISYDDEFNQFKDFKITGKARLPYYKEIPNYYSNPKVYGFLYDYLCDCKLDNKYTPCEETLQVNTIDGITGYWTMASAEHDEKPTQYGYAVFANGRAGRYSVSNKGDNGVRPVINVKL